MYSDKQDWANSVDPDEMSQKVAPILFATHPAIFRHNIRAQLFKANDVVIKRFVKI